MNSTLSKIERLLALKGEKAAEMLRNLDIKQSTYYTWKQRDILPSSDCLMPIARYLGVTADYLLSDSEDLPEEKSEEDEYYLDPETKVLADSIKNNVGQRVLFDAAKDLPPEDILKVLDFIQQQNKKEGRE